MSEMMSSIPSQSVVEGALYQSVHIPGVCMCVYVCVCVHVCRMCK